MFTTQAGRIEQALISGGLNPMAAMDVSASVGNCAQPLKHRGPVSADYTPPDFRFVTPELRKYRFPNLEGVSGEMPRLRPPQEEKRREDDLLPQPPQAENRDLREPFQPTINYYVDGGSGAAVVGGQYISVLGGTVSLNGGGRSGDVAVFRNNALVGTPLVIKTGNPKLLKVEQEGLTTTITPRGQYVNVVTGLEVVGDRLKIDKLPVYVLAPENRFEGEIPLENIQYVYDVVEGSSLTFKRESRYVLGTPAEEASPVDIDIVDCVV